MVLAASAVAEVVTSSALAVVAEAGEVSAVLVVIKIMKVTKINKITRGTLPTHLVLAGVAFEGI